MYGTYMDLKRKAMPTVGHTNQKAQIHVMKLLNIESISRLPQLQDEKKSEENVV